MTSTTTMTKLHLLSSSLTLPLSCRFYSSSCPATTRIIKSGIPTKKKKRRSNSNLLYRQHSTTTTSSSSSSSSSSTSSTSSLPSSCDIVKGPSLLRTTVHRPRPSLLYLPGLRSLPFWSQQQQQQPNQPTTTSSTTTTTTTKVAYQDPTLSWVVKHFEHHWETIRDEYQSVAPSLSSDYQTDTEHHTAVSSSSSSSSDGSNKNNHKNNNNNKDPQQQQQQQQQQSQALHQGQWDWHSYLLKGQVQDRFVQHFPQTQAILQQVREKGLLFEQVPFGYAFFSTLHPKSHIAPHVAPMNFRIRLHLPLIVPKTNTTNTTANTTETNSTSTNDNSQDNTTRRSSSSAACGIQVGSVERPWIPGKAMLLDDSYIHSVWNHTETARVLLLVDLWHPDITVHEQQDIVALFQHAQEQGWWNQE